jgi:hypothetical protein
VDFDLNTGSVGAGLLANAFIQPPSAYQTHRVRQQAGSYRRLHSSSTASVRNGSSRKAVDQHTICHSVHPVWPAHATAISGKTGSAFIFTHKRFSRCKTRLGCRLNAGLAQWAEPHGCGESAVRTWMSVRRGPTERDRSEGTPTKEEPNQEDKPLVTWGFFK